MSFHEYRNAVAESVASGQPSTYGQRLDVIPSHLQQGLHMPAELPAKSPHWLMPAMDGPSTTGSKVISVNGSSVTGSGATARGGPGGLGHPVSYNAWGPDGEFARMVKTPTTVSDSTVRTETTNRQQENLGRKGWAKPVSPQRGSRRMGFVLTPLAHAQAAAPAPRLPEVRDPLSGQRRV